MVRACGVSDVGRVRKTNEDTYVSDPEMRLFAVADGMGGHSAGEVASRLAIDALAAFIRRSNSNEDITWPYGLDQALSHDGNRLRTGIHLANRRVFRAAEGSADYSGMGTTIVGLLVNGSRASVAHVGDSRFYLFSKGRLLQLTKDDSWAAAMLEQDPHLSLSVLANHPMRNVLTNVLGAHEHVDVHLSERPLDTGDLMLLCTDGLHGALGADVLAELLTSASEVEVLAHMLVETAMERGSRDNITALVVRYEADA